MLVCKSFLFKFFYDLFSYHVISIITCNMTLYIYRQGNSSQYSQDVIYEDILRINIMELPEDWLEFGPFVRYMMVYMWYYKLIKVYLKILQLRHICKRPT